MLTLVDALHVDGVDVYRDAVVRDGQLAFTDTYFYLRSAPLVALDDDGAPAFRLTRYRGAAGDASALGGLLVLEIGLGLTAEELSQLRVAVAERFGHADADAIDLQPVRGRGGSVQLGVAGTSSAGAGDTADGEEASSPGDDIVRSIGGCREAPMVGAQRAAFAVHLTGDGANLLDAALDTPAPTLWARYDLEVDHLLTAVRLRVWCDAERSWKALEERQHAGVLDPGAVGPILREQMLAGVELTQSGEGVDEEHLDELRKLGHEVLDQVLAATFFADTDGAPAEGAPAEGESTGEPTLRPFEPGFQERLDLTFDENSVLQATLSPQGALALSIPEEQRDRHITLIDVAHLPHEPLDVAVYCPLDFEGGPIDLVKVWLEHPASGERTTMVFKDRAQIGTFRCFPPEGADPAIRYECEVHYLGGADPLRTEPVTTLERQLVLNLDGMGVVDVEVLLGTLATGTADTTVVELSYPGHPQPARLILDGETPSGRWQAVVREHPLRPYGYHVAWNLSDGRRIEGAERETHDRRLYVEGPPLPVDRTEVRVLFAGDFSPFARVLVELRHEDEPEIVRLDFRGSGETQTWTPRIHDPEAFQYEYRPTVFYVDGRVEQGEWLASNQRILVLGDRGQMLVTVVPLLLDLEGSLKLAVVGLEALDDGVPTGDRKMLSFTRNDEDQMWAFRPADPSQPEYRYQLTLYTAEGQQLVGEWTPEHRELLVLRPIEE